MRARDIVSRCAFRGQGGSHFFEREVDFAAGREEQAGEGGRHAHEMMHEDRRVAGHEERHIQHAAGDDARRVAAGFERTPEMRAHQVKEQHG